MRKDQGGLTAWALDGYRQPGVMPALLALQDEFGLDVLLLLNTAWLWSRGCSLPVGALGGLLARHSPWQAQVVMPLREVRRKLKPDAAAQELYQQVKAVELEAELLQLGRLQVWAEELSVRQQVALTEQLRELSVALLRRKGDARLQSLLEQYAAAVISFSSSAE